MESTTLDGETRHHFGTIFGRILDVQDVQISSVSKTLAAMELTCSS